MEDSGEIYGNAISVRIHVAKVMNISKTNFKKMVEIVHGSPISCKQARFPFHVLKHMEIKAPVGR